jgi:LmbE family N-acetylglucosaminyl deacetylase
MNILVIAAHPDDEVLGCGATIARLAGEGHSVSILILGEGITSRLEKREYAAPEAVAALRAQSRDVGKHLGASQVWNLNYPDNRFDTVALLEIVKSIEAHVALCQPERVYTHAGGDLNIDHSIACRATLTATRPAAGHRVREVLSYEVASSTEWAMQQFHPPFQPNVFVDVAKTLETKIQALAIYESEGRPFPHPRSAQNLRAAAQHWGSLAGMTAAEPFVLLRAFHDQ